LKVFQCSLGPFFTLDAVHDLVVASMAGPIEASNIVDSIINNDLFSVETRGMYDDRPEIAQIFDRFLYMSCCL
jgi:hypothetical protein